MRGELMKMDERIAEQEREVAVWQDYMEHGQYEHKTQIQLLEQELNDMQYAFDEMACEWYIR